MGVIVITTVPSLLVGAWCTVVDCPLLCQFIFFLLFEELELF